MADTTLQALTWAGMANTIAAENSSGPMGRTIPPDNFLALMDDIIQLARIVEQMASIMPKALSAEWTVDTTRKVHS